MTFMEKEEHVVALWVLALLRAFKAFPSLQEEVHLSVGEGKDKADLLEAISVEVTKRKSLDKDAWQDIFLKLERGQHGREDIVKAMKRLKDTIRECGAVGYKPDADLKRRALKSMLTKSEWNDSTEKASLKTGNKVSELTYDEILVHVDTKVNTTKDYEITRPVDGRSSSSPPKRNHEFGTAADRSQCPKGRGKGRRGKKSNRKEKSFQGEGGEESQSRAAASGAASSSQTWPCPNCGHMKHLDPKKGCPAANVRCSFEGCGMVGHYMKCCPKNPKRKQQQAKAAGEYIPMQKGTMFQLREDRERYFSDEDF
uniref:CCHC-type domain-containing protein n=1 Tax=Chromera velia CCMP2878 TaxID=1169474 RepID=A0A0G4GKZ6_9ALVE|eukprot:Cvel_22381.t1-p1 / transcript=Cvel_22381.t1 / gene=Cvel_22381 / organism=Chromera_velia_CCMP2878 / gene_product=hypothetical protein / transcript_product=hypothetical protein / location=Cvel_scaffold2194:1440-2372(-) / protein_length=311 / sequence_SO=supercontig / SO=protein_coding / is_pseudo=false